MTESTMVVGCDVHKDKIKAQVLPSQAARPTEIVTIENNPRVIARFVERLAHSALEAVAPPIRPVTFSCCDSS